MVVQPKHRFSVKVYYPMAETGLLRPDARGRHHCALAFPDAAVDVAELLRK